MQQGQKRIKTIQTFFILALVCSLFFHTAHPAQGFIVSKIKELTILLDEIDKPQWIIAYNFTADCPDEFKQKDEEIKEQITKALNAWLQPLRERYPERKFTDDFIFVRQPDVAQCREEWKNLLEVDTRVTFSCQVGRSFAVRSQNKKAPDLCIMEGIDIDRAFSFALMHELGHAFGMEDTYILPHQPSTGGLANTRGKQPTSLMSGRFNPPSPFHLGEDDIKGIIWLYKYLYEDQPVKDCFFPDYVYEEETRGCRPKYPLIFEVKHVVANSVERILRDDPTLDVNARDAAGNTALHHAVLRNDLDMVKVLLTHANIQVKTLDRHGRSPAKLARELGRAQLAQMIEAHPSAQLPPRAVARPWTLATTWGAVKRKR